MKIALASDHGGLKLKQVVAQHLIDKGFVVQDFGTDSLDSCDYPLFVYPASLSVAHNECDFAVVICTTGIGASIVANKVNGVRCALCGNVYQAEMTRRHNNSNVLALGANIVDTTTALEITDKFFETKFEGGRHQRRIDEITEIERKSRND
ncbi:MAG: ribose 5-phosphate isomerase B [Clostridia bacterium]